jgi:hypothetical protein
MISDELLSLAAGALVDESAIDMTTDDGRVLEVWTISSEGAAVRASAPRLEVREGMQLECRIIIGSLPHRIVSVIDQAELQSQSRAALTLRVIDVALDGQRRRSKRLEVSMPASLTAMVCDRLVPGEHLTGMISDVSEGGIAISVPDLRPRDGDRLRLRARVFEGTIDCELRIVSARASDSSGSLVLGCVFLEPPAEMVATLKRLLERIEAGEPALPPTTDPSVRESLGIQAQPQSDERPAAYRSLPLGNRGLASA